MPRFNLRDGVDPQKYGIGLKELWEVAPAQAQAGPRHAHAGLAARRATSAAARSCTTSATNLVAVGFVVHLNYENPHLSPYDEFQRFKTHPAIRDTFEGGKRIALRRARDQRRRPAVGAEARVSRAAR